MLRQASSDLLAEDDARAAMLALVGDPDQSGGVREAAFDALTIVFPADFSTQGNPDLTGSIRVQTDEGGDDSACSRWRSTANWTSI